MVHFHIIYHARSVVLVPNHKSLCTAVTQISHIVCMLPCSIMPAVFIWLTNTDRLQEVAVISVNRQVR